MKETIGFIGLGGMGLAMATNLSKGGGKGDCVRSCGKSVRRPSAFRALPH